MPDKTNQDRLPPKPHDYTQSAPRSSAMRPRLRAHETVLVRTHETLSVGELATRSKQDDGGNWLRDKVAELKRRRIDTAILRKEGRSVVDHEAEALTFASITDMQDFRRRLDFDVTLDVEDKDGGKRSVTSSAFALLTSNMAHADAEIGAESVPMIADELVTDLDDVSPQTEVPELLEFAMTETGVDPKPLGETEEFREVGAGEDRYTIISWRDGYQRAFTQTLLNRLGGSQVAQQLMDLGRGAMEVQELFVIRKVIDYHGSKGSNQKHHVMIRNRAAAALFSATANTPSTRTPDGTRLNNNALTGQSDVEAMRARLAGMLNAAGYPAPVPFRKMLVPDALWLTAWTIFNSQGTGVFGESNFFGPGGPVRPQLLSSPFLDLLTTTDWYGGDPQRQFLRKFALRPTVAVHGGNGTQAYVRSHEAMRVSIGWDMNVGVRCHTRWCESLDNSTAPGGA